MVEIKPTLKNCKYFQNLCNVSHITKNNYPVYILVPMILVWHHKFSGMIHQKTTVILWGNHYVTLAMGKYVFIWVDSCGNVWWGCIKWNMECILISSFFLIWPWLFDDTVLENIFGVRYTLWIKLRNFDSNWITVTIKFNLIQK